jgi:hypothetical protein
MEAIFNRIDPPGHLMAKISLCLFEVMDEIVPIAKEFHHLIGHRRLAEVIPHNVHHLVDAPERCFDHRATHTREGIGDGLANSRQVTVGDPLVPRRSERPAEGVQFSAMSAGMVGCRGVSIGSPFSEGLELSPRGETRQRSFGFMGMFATPVPVLPISPWRERTITVPR